RRGGRALPRRAEDDAQERRSDQHRAGDRGRLIGVSAIRHTRQARLAEVGEDGQASLARGDVSVRGAGLSAAIEARFLAGAVLGAVGNPPLVRSRVVAAKARGVDVYAKLEFANPGGSVKDRPALRMIQDALADGRLTRDKTLIDSTSGNTGVAYSLYGAAFGV